MQRVLVTGATGLVGRNVCRALLARGDSVVAVIRKTSRRDQLPGNIEYYTVDGIDKSTTWNKGLLRSVDWVVHLAGAGHDHDGNQPANEGGLHGLHVGGTEKLLAAAEGHVARFVHLSAAESTGSELHESVHEQTPCDPQTPFGRTKLAGEKVVHEFATKSRTETVILRPAPVYGEGKLGRLNRLFEIVQSGKMLPFGLFNSRRSLVSVANLVDAIITCLDHPEAAGETFLVSDGEDITLKDLIRTFGDVLGHRGTLLPVPVSLVRFGSLITGNRKTVNQLLGSFVVDSGKLRSTLGWQPPQSLADGLAAAVMSRINSRAA